MAERKGFKPTYTPSTKSNSSVSHSPARVIKKTTRADGMPVYRSCGVILFRKVASEAPKFDFLLMKHQHRYDLAKGHQEEGETDWDTALRECQEETSIDRAHIKVAPNFQFTETYYPTYKRAGNIKVEKTICMFVGIVSDAGVSQLKLTEHGGCEWKPWSPPNPPIQKNTIDPLVKELEKFFALNPIEAESTWQK